LSTTFVVYDIFIVVIFATNEHQGSEILKTAIKGI